MAPRYFFDAYALLRLREGAASHERFRLEPVITERGHLYEFTRELLKRVSAREARIALGALAPNRIEPTDDDLVEAAKLHRDHARMSAQDALGYVLARREGLRFLTGDRAFRKMAGVEFVE